MNNKVKKVLLVTQFFYPENFKSNDIAFELTKRGYKIDVLTSIPNYPEGSYYKGYGFFLKRFELVNGVKIYRAFQFPRGRDNKALLMLSYLSYAIFGSVWALILSIAKRYDCIIVHQTSPITQGFPAFVIKKIQNIPIYFWVLDLWPDAMISGGGVTNRKLLSCVDKIVKWMYKNSDVILISSEDFRLQISNKCNNSQKIIYFPNWSDDILHLPDNYEIPFLPKGFIIMLAGNLGGSQNLDAVMKAAIELRNDKNIRWIIIGDGSRKQWLINFVNNNNLNDTVFILGKYPIEAMPTFYKYADVMLLTLNGEYQDLKHYVPARLQSYMAAGKPIIGMIDGASADLILKSKCGYVVRAGDYSELANIIINTKLTDMNTLIELGKNGRIYYEKHFMKHDCISNLCNIIENKNN